jgi:hypothetical protein
MRPIQFALLSVVLVLSAQSVMAGTAYVGGCKHGAFKTIQTAVDTVPAGTIIDVCPGTYAEQIVLHKALTLRSISFSNSSQAIISVPSGGLTTTSSLATGTVAAQVEVTTGPVNITGITVDGTATSSNCPGSDYVGIFYSSGSSGTVNEVETRNQNCGGGLGGIGIIVENGAGNAQSVTIENSDVNSFSKVGIWACSNQTPTTLTALIRSNYIAGGFAGVETECNAGVSTNAGSVSGNNITAFSAIGVFNDSASSAISGNTITGGFFGIEVEHPTAVTANQISNSSFAGISLDVAGASVKTNTITQAPIGIEFNCKSGTVSGNIINGAATGIDTVPAAFTGVNKFYNVATVRVGGC